MRRLRAGGAVSPAVVVALVLAAVVLGAGALLVSRRADSAAPVASPTAAPVDDLALRVDGRGKLSADGDTLVLMVPVAVDAPGPVTLGAPTGLPPTLHALDTRTPVPSGGTGSLRLGWDGPDCTRDVPDRVLPDLTLPVTFDGRTLKARLDTSDADQLLRQTWVSGCGIQPTPPQGR